jgi:signal peptidase I
VNEDVGRRPPAIGEAQTGGPGKYPSSQSTDEVVVLTGFRSAEVGVAESQATDADKDTDLSSVPASQVEPPPQRRGKLLSSLRELVETIVLALIFFFALRAVVQNFRVEGSSMYPSFTDGQYVLVNKVVYAHFRPGDIPEWAPFLRGNGNAARYLFHPPERGDVIVFHPPPPNDQHRDFIKRVIALPGDTVDIRQGHVFVNGAELSEPFIRQSTLPINALFAHAVLGPDEYYVMGDNRGNSSDSRAWGGIRSDSIVGRTWLIYWPFGSIRVAPNHSEPVPPPASATP